MEKLAKCRVSRYLQLSNSTPSLYTGESLKAYKSLEAYNNYINGWIDDVKVVKITKLVEPHYMVTAAVRHSQKLTIPPAKPWVAAKQNGTSTVVCAHCSCMAGLGEACSHIAALLFTLEATTTMNQNTRCTSLPYLPSLPGHLINDFNRIYT